MNSDLLMRLFEIKLIQANLSKRSFMHTLSQAFKTAKNCCLEKMRRSQLYM